MNGAITSYIDVAQLVLYAFWIFFIGLIIYLRREDKREGYPLDSDRTQRTDRVEVQGFPRRPAAKTYQRTHGGTSTLPRPPDPVPTAMEPAEPWPGAPMVPTGNPMLDGVGPGAYAQRSDTPDLAFDGKPLLQPMRVATEFTVEARDPDPRGMEVVGADGEVAGIVHDVWVDRAEPQIRYLEVLVTSNQRHVLVPIGFARFERYRRRVIVRSIRAAHFAEVPGLAQPDQVTLREEDRISAYYGGGTLYAEPSRLGPFL
jgi:photosynthetic reaction center H subunit